MMYLELSCLGWSVYYGFLLNNSFMYTCDLLRYCETNAQKDLLVFSNFFKISITKIIHIYHYTPKIRYVCTCTL